MTDEHRKDDRPEPGKPEEADRERRGTRRETPEETPEEARSRGDGPVPPAGPHDAPGLTNPDATPGSGTLPAHDRKGGDTDPGGG